MTKSAKVKRDELATDYSVNDNWARNECGYDRDRRHFEAGYDAGYAEARREAEPLVKALLQVKYSRNIHWSIEVSDDALDAWEKGEE